LSVVYDAVLSQQLMYINGFCQIYNDATLLVYFPFDTTWTVNDHSVNLFHGISSDTTVVEQVLYFYTSTSYFQSKCFPNANFHYGYNHTRYLVVLYFEPQYITLGNNSPLGPLGGISCLNGLIPIVSGPFKGGIDEFRLYNRELDSQEICVLANI